jgi:hypothetical protein
LKCLHGRSGQCHREKRLVAFERFFVLYTV